jgi:hypothetical protein
MTEDQAHELLAHLVASAEICAVEPAYYGTFRLLDAAARLLATMEGDDPWPAELRREIEQKKLLLMSDREAYFAYLPVASHRVAQRLRDRQLGTGRA